MIDAALMMVFVICLTQIRGQQVARARKAVTLESMLGGVRFVWHTKVILAAITLDLFAVLFGGATTLLPVFAKDILHVGAEGFGWLRAAPSIGAVLVAVLLLGRPPMRQAGKSLLLAVAGFGLATIVFGLSRSFPLSLAMLVLAGGLDMISVVVRQTLVQLRTPDEMRGRVSAVNSVFIDTSNELGGFESGASAALLGPVVSVVGGGIVTVLVVSAVAVAWPELRSMRGLADDLPPASTSGGHMKFVMRIVVTAIALWAATRLVTGISFAGNWIGLAGVALVFGLLNSFVRPVLTFLAFPLLIVTLGLFTFVLNAVMLMLTSWLSTRLGIGFHVAGFWAAFWGAIVVGIVSFLLSIFLPDTEREAARLTVSSGGVTTWSEPRSGHERTQTSGESPLARPSAQDHEQEQTARHRRLPRRSWARARHRSRR